MRGVAIYVQISKPILYRKADSLKKPAFLTELISSMPCVSRDTVLWQLLCTVQYFPYGFLDFVKFTYISFPKITIEKDIKKNYPLQIKFIFPFNPWPPFSVKFTVIYIFFTSF